MADIREEINVEVVQQEAPQYQERGKRKPRSGDKKKCDGGYSMPHKVRANCISSSNTSSMNNKEGCPKLGGRGPGITTDWQRDINNQGFAKCPKCPIGYSTVGALWVHHSNCKGLPDPRARQCIHCPMLVATERGLTRHMNLAHGELVEKMAISRPSTQPNIVDCINAQLMGSVAVTQNGQTTLKQYETEQRTRGRSKSGEKKVGVAEKLDVGMTNKVDMVTKANVKANKSDVSKSNKADAGMVNNTDVKKNFNGKLAVRESKTAPVPKRRSNTFLEAEHLRETILAGTNFPIFGGRKTRNSMDASDSFAPISIKEKPPVVDPRLSKHSASDSQNNNARDNTSDSKSLVNGSATKRKRRDSSASQSKAENITKSTSKSDFKTADKSKCSTRLKDAKSEPVLEVTSQREAVDSKLKANKNKVSKGDDSVKTALCDKKLEARQSNGRSREFKSLIPEGANIEKDNSSVVNKDGGSVINIDCEGTNTDVGCLVNKNGGLETRTRKDSGSYKIPKKSQASSGAISKPKPAEEEPVEAPASAVEVVLPAATGVCAPRKKRGRPPKERIRVSLDQEEDVEPPPSKKRKGKASMKRLSDGKKVKKGRGGDLVCPLCGLVFDVRAQLRYHKFSVHNGLIRDNGDVSTPLTHEETTVLLRKTIKIIKKLHCLKPECDKSFISVEGYRMHVQSCGLVNKADLKVVLSCTICGKTLRDASLKYHMTNVHGPKKMAKKGLFDQLPDEVALSGPRKSAVKAMRKVKGMRRHLASESKSEGAAEPGSNDCDGEWSDVANSTDSEEYKEAEVEEEDEDQSSELVATATGKEGDAHRAMCYATRPPLRENAVQWTRAHRERNFSTDQLFPELQPRTVLCPKSTVVDQLYQDGTKSAQFQITNRKDYAAKKSSSESTELNNDWTQLSAFETHRDTRSKSFTAFAGAQITSFAWCPSAAAGAQFLAVCCALGHGDAEDTTVSNDQEPRVSVIQLWELAEDRSSLRLATIFDLGRVGVVWDVAWCPSGAREEPNGVGASRLGLLALACSSGFVYIHSIPHPSQTGSQPVVYSSHPCLILRQQPLASPEAPPPQPICLSWSETKGHNQLAAGFVSGEVSLWRLSGSCAFLDEQENGELGPVTTRESYLTFQAHAGSVSGIAFCPSTDGTEARYMATGGGSDRMCLTWDLRDPATPVNELRKSSVKHISWSLLWGGYFIAYDNCYQFAGAGDAYLDSGYYRTDECRIITYHDAPSLHNTVSDWNSTYLSCSESGEVKGCLLPYLVTYPREKKHKRTHMTLYQAVTEKTKAESETSDSEIGYQEAVQSTRLVFVDNCARTLKEYAANSAGYVKTKCDWLDYGLNAVTDVRWNPNYHFRHCVATALRSRMFRVHFLHSVLS